MNDLAQTTRGVLMALGYAAEAIERALEVLTQPSRAPARNESPSGDEISLDREEWLKIAPLALDQHDAAEKIDEAIAIVRPALSAAERARCWRDFGLWNSRVAAKAGKKATARRMRDLLGFAAKWEDKLGLWKATRRAGRAAYVAAQATVARVVSGKPLTELQRLKAKASVTQHHAQERDLVERIGREAYESRVLGMISRFGCDRRDARIAVHGEAAGVEIMPR